MANAKKLPSGNWRVNLFVGRDESGKRKYKSFTASNKKTAEYMAAEYAAMHKGKSEIENITVGEAIDRYIDSKSNVLSPATVRGYRRYRKNYLQDIINVRLPALTNEIIQKEINREAKLHSAKTVKNMYGLFSAAMGAYNENLALRITLPQKTKSEINVPSDDSIKELLKCIKGSELEKAVLLSAFGSMRRSEIAPLTSDDICGNIIEVNKAMVYNDKNEWVLKSPKTFSSYRKIEYPEFVIRLFDGIEGRLINMNPNQITGAFSCALKKHNLPHIRFHDLRHYQASILHALGVPDIYIMERGGWKSRYTLDKVYKHVMDDKMQASTAVAINHFTNLMQHEMQHD